MESKKQIEADGKQVQMFFCVLPDDGKARYDALKKYCCQDAGSLLFLSIQFTNCRLVLVGFSSDSAAQNAQARIAKYGK